LRIAEDGRHSAYRNAGAACTRQWQHRLDLLIESMRRNRLHSKTPKAMQQKAQAIAFKTFHLFTIERTEKAAALA